MCGSILFFSFVEEAAKGGELSHQTALTTCSFFFFFNYRKTDPNLSLTNFKKRFYQVQFLLVVSLTFRQTEQFEIVCLLEKLLTCRDPRKKIDVSFCQIFE